MCSKGVTLPKGIEPLQGEQLIREAVPSGPLIRASRVANWFTDVGGSLYLTSRRIIFLQRSGPLAPSALSRNLEWNLGDVAQVEEDRPAFLKPPLFCATLLIPPWRPVLAVLGLIGLLFHGLAPWAFLFPSRLAVSFVGGERQVFIVADAAQWVQSLRSAVEEAKREQAR
jgi:hypothetical protein